MRPKFNQNQIFVKILNLHILDTIVCEKNHLTFKGQYNESAYKFESFTNLKINSTYYKKSLNYERNMKNGPVSLSFGPKSKKPKSLFFIRDTVYVGIVKKPSHATVDTFPFYFNFFGIIKK